MKLLHFLRYTTCLTFLTVLTPFSPAQATAPTGKPVVVTRAGAVSGTGGEVESFKGIPYAAPPVGPLRWRAPQPAKAWKGVRDATHFGDDCMQRPYVIPTGQKTSEDCLTLSVWTPGHAPGAHRPVMVFLYGGGFIGGSDAYPLYDGAKLAANGVVVVGPNYRVGIFGFLAHPALSAEAPHKSSGNYGLLDQIAALEWVRDNIAAFGGDPGRVTVFGQSAGAGSVAALLAMPSAAGLFGRAVAQSVPGTFFTPELAAGIASACASELGLRPTAAELSVVDPLLLAAAGDAVTARLPESVERWGPVAYRSITFSPVVDPDSLPVTPWQALAAGAGQDVDLLVGHTREEHRLLSLLDGLLGQVTHEQAEQALRILAPGPDGARRYREGFLGAGPNELHEVVNSDWLFRMPSLHLVQAHRDAGGRAHLYELTWPAPGLGGILGACHGLDVPLVFGNLDRGQPAALFGDAPP